MKQGCATPIGNVTRPLALLVSLLLLAAGLTVASGAQARDARSGAASDLASQLLPIRGGNDEAIDSARQVDLTISRAERVLVQVYVSGPAGAAADRLRAAGMSVKATAEEPVPVVEGWVKATALTSVARLGVTDAVLPVMAGGSDAGSVQSEGVAAHRIPQALTSGAVAGDGVDVGVISTSIDQLGGGISDSQATGDLPQTVTVLKDDLAAVDDEGRAMAEIIFDGAPGIDSIIYASGTVAGPADKADSIDRLVAAGADVIADDIFWLNEPFFQDGAVAQAVDRARAAGVTYIASAGNRARQSWEGTYDGTASNPGFHDFDPGAGSRNLPDRGHGAERWSHPVGHPVGRDLGRGRIRPRLQAGPTRRRSPSVFRGTGAARCEPESAVSTTTRRPVSRSRSWPGRTTVMPATSRLP